MESAHHPPAPCLGALFLLAMSACDFNSTRDPLHRFEAATTELPDIVLITLDTTRADHLGAYGYPRATSPAFDRLAAESLLFENFVVPMATTLPVHLSLFTGLEPEEHGVLANKDFQNRRFVPPANAHTLASTLGAQGYDTAAFVSAAPVKKHTGLEKGFARFGQPQESERRAKKTTDRALTWLSDKAEPPYLLWVHYYDPHDPYRPPREQRKALDVDDSLRSWAEERGLDEPHLVPLARYDAEILSMDEQLGRLVDSLRRAGRWENTIVVVAGDHGEGLGQHGVERHGLVWSEQTHAPLLIRASDIEPDRHPGMVTASDIVPTLLGMVDLPDEVDLLAQTSGQDVLADGDPRQAVLSRSSLRRSDRVGDAHKTFPDTWALTTPEWTLHWTRKGPTALHDLDDDPYERSSVLDEHPELAQDLWHSGTWWLKSQRERGKQLGAGKLEAMDPELVRQLEELGYVE